MGKQPRSVPSFTPASWGPQLQRIVAYLGTAPPPSENPPAHQAASLTIAKSVSIADAPSHSFAPPLCHLASK